MSNIGIPTWVFQLQPWNSEAREPTSEDDEVWDETAEGQTITRELALKKCGKLLLQGLN